MENAAKIWDATTETYGDPQVLYRSEKGDPILLMTTNTPWCMETEVIITDSQGNVTIWYPFVDEDNHIASAVGAAGRGLHDRFNAHAVAAARALGAGGSGSARAALASVLYVQRLSV